MRFYLVTDTDGSVIDCTTKWADARGLMDAGHPGAIDIVEVPVNAESIRLLLAGNGGYATNSKRIYPRSST